MPDSDILRSLFMADCSLIVEHSGVISWCNLPAMDLLGITPGFEAGWDLPRELGLFHPRRDTPMQFHTLPLGRLLAGEAIEPLELCVRNSRTGYRDVWMRLIAEPVFPSGGEFPEAALILARDITAEMKMRRRLEADHEALLAIVNASPLAIVTLDGACDVSFWNRAAETLFGWTGDEALGNPPPWETRPDGNNGATRGWRKDGSGLELELSAAPVLPGRPDSGSVVLVADSSPGRGAGNLENLFASILANVGRALADAAPGSAQETALREIAASVTEAAANCP